MSEKQPVWFKTPAQVYRYLACEVGEEFVWGDKDVAVKESGLVFGIAQKTVYNHVNEGLLKSRRRGGFARRTVDQYARRELGDKAVAGSNGDTPEDDEPEGESELARTRRTLADAASKEVDAELKRIKLQEKLGEIVELALVERELGERQQAWKLYMTAFMRDHKAELLSVLGGDLEVAREIVELVGGDQEKAEALSGWMFAKSPLLLDLFRKRIIEGLNVFAMGEWFTDEVREAWEKWKAGERRRSINAAAALIDLVGGDSEQLDTVLERFEVKAREACP